MSTNQLAKKSYFGAASFIMGIISALFSGASYGIVFLNIDLDLFNLLNKLTALVFCSLTPVTIFLGVMGLIRKNDSKPFSLMAITLVTIPTVIIFISLLNSFKR